MADDPFRDAEKDIEAQRGVLDGSAYQNHERVTDAPNRDGEGQDFTCNCQNCNRQSVVTIPWEELVVASVGVLPMDKHTRHPWIMQNGFLYPPAVCGACRQLLSVPITPDKANRILRHGVSMNHIQAGWVRAKQEETLRAVQHLQRR